MFLELDAFGAGQHQLEPLMKCPWNSQSGVEVQVYGEDSIGQLGSDYCWNLICESSVSCQLICSTHDAVSSGTEKEEKNKIRQTSL